MKNYSIYLILLLFLACKNKREDVPLQEPDHFVPHTEEIAEQTYHTDTTYEYEYRTGESGDYQYNYDVSGTNNDGEEFSGNVLVQDKYGTGTLTDCHGNEIDVEVEWIDYGKLKGIDKEGNEYELDVD